MSASTLRAISGLGAGLVFGLGLVLSGMADPAKVLNFLDIAGTWDPSLAFVMGAAVAVAAVGFRVVLGWKQPLFEERFFIPSASDLDLRLVGGAALFGVGWGLAGFCPGPALTSLALGSEGTVVFVAAMIAGMWAGRQV